MKNGGTVSHLHYTLLLLKLQLYLTRLYSQSFTLHSATIKTPASHKDKAPHGYLHYTLLLLKL